MLDKKAWQLYSYHSNRSDSCKTLYFWHLFHGPGSSQNLPSAYFKRKQETLAELWPLLCFQGLKNKHSEGGFGLRCFTEQALTNPLNSQSSQKTPKKNKQHLCNTRGQPSGFALVFFFHKESWSFINPSPRTTNAPQPEWIRLREDYISNPPNSFFFLLNLFFTSRPQKYNQGQEEY